MRKFTDDQQKVIDLRDRDILVSAAAGSGKTTVLVERIIKKITDEKNPVDIDRILVVTFTRAAAKEMREKIRTAIDEALMADPDNETLKRQAAFVFHAQITTIDAFCNHVLKDHFHRVGAEPDFRIGDARELSILSKEVMDELMDAHYEAKDEEFLNLVDTYIKNNRDDEITQMILDLYTVSSAAPWPDEWLNDLLSVYEDPDDMSWLNELIDSAKKQIADIKSIVDSQLLLIDTEAPDHPYRDAIAADAAMIDRLFECDGYDSLYDGLSSLSFDRLSTKKYTDPYEGFKQGIKDKRDAYKKQLSAIGKDMIYMSLSDAKDAMKRVGKHVKTLVSLAGEYSMRFFEKKQEKNVLDFSDVEHLALDILVDRDTKKATETAIELRALYEEILIDEYQDSNYLQETILRTISREEEGDNNYFMVGDVKQSIYAFRQARPEIFADKYHSFSVNDSKQQRIDLDMNFRSRREVIDSVNAAFLPLMDAEMGGVDYDEAASLKPGASYPGVPGVDFTTELLLGEKDTTSLSDEDVEIDEEDYDGEYLMIAERIRQLKKDFKVTDKETGQLRNLKYSDVVILIRAVKGRGERLLEILNSFGMPVYVTDESGYFESREVETILSLLTVLDNPRSDIPLAAVMKSPLFGFSDEELARIRIADKEVPFYKAVFSYEGDEKHQNFLKFIDTYRKKISTEPIHVLLQQIFSETGYADIVRAMPGGENRAANLNRLIDMAVNFERTSFKGLFKFVNYIRQLKKYDQDLGTADLIGEDDDAIRIMTIHKSKGLEFPVVFLSGINRKFNLKDASGVCVLSPDGIALEDIRKERGTKSKYLYKSYLSKKMIADALGEEMRVLYVAMTRAKEKLIITGTYKDGESFEGYDGRISFSKKIHARCYADFLYPVIFSESPYFKIKRFDAKELCFITDKNDLINEINREDVKTLAASSSDEIKDEYESLSIFKRKLQPIELKAKYSVSELKHRSMEAYADENDVPLFSGGGGGAARGSVMHLFMEHFDFKGYDKANPVDSQIAKMIDHGHMTEDDAKLLDRKKLAGFVESDLCRRMANADESGLLFREKPFVMGKHPDELLKEYYPDVELPAGDGAPMLLVQGIIDAFFVEDDDIVLLDYKTDAVSAESELIGRYQKQMDLYADALESGFAKKVSQKLIYSFTLDKEVLL